jgi:lipopolysaccharide biosynthesis glycosyltransferase
MKKDLAIVLGATGNISFALANVIIGLVRHKPATPFDIIVYEQGISEEDKGIINSIYSVNFIEYNTPEKIKEVNSSALQRFTELSLSIYECFGLLDEYKKIIWLDCDVLIQDKIDNLINQTNNQMWMFLETNKTPNNKTIQCYNSGIVVFNDKIDNYQIMTKWCYDKTAELIDKIINPDQAVLNFLIQNFNIEITDKPEGLFNCHPVSKKSHKAKIVHSAYTEKFWNFYYYRQWEENYKKWIKLGGSPCLNKTNKPFEAFLKINYPFIFNFFKAPRKTVKQIFKINP